MILGCDLSPEYSRGFDVEVAFAAGVRFVGVKLSDGLKGYDRYEAGIDTLDAARYGGRRMVGIGYHYVRAGTTAAQQAAEFARQLERAGHAPGMLDVEDGDVSTLDLAREVHYHATRLGANLVLTYLPRWWWDRVGQPSLAGLPPLWGSQYVAKARVEVVGTPEDIAKGIASDAWAPYGGKEVEVVQYTRKAQIGSTLMTADAFPGTLAEFEALVAEPPR